MVSYVAKCGEYGILRRVWVDKRLRDCPSGQCGVVFNRGSVVLVSYKTAVCSIDRDGWFSIGGLYSMTTRRHIRHFLAEYAPGLSYQDAKRAYEKNLMVNVNSGEWLPVAA